MTTDQDSLHDSLTDAHQHAPQSSSYQHVDMSSASIPDAQGVEQRGRSSGSPSLVSPLAQDDNTTNTGQSIFGDASASALGIPSPSIQGNTAQTVLGGASQWSFGNIAQRPPEGQPHSASESTTQSATSPTTAQLYQERPSQPDQYYTAPLSSTFPITAFETNDAFQQAEHGVEVGRDSEQDDGYETDGSAASMSLASSARNFIFENGRRYHSFRAGAYSFPNDDREQDREDLKHAMFLKLFNKSLHFAPIPTKGAINVIDLGTGTGIWSIDCECLLVALLHSSLINSQSQTNIPTPQFSGSTSAQSRRTGCPRTSNSWSTMPKASGLIQLLTSTTYTQDTQYKHFMIGRGCLNVALRTYAAYMRVRGCTNCLADTSNLAAGWNVKKSTTFPVAKTQAWPPTTPWSNTGTTSPTASLPPA
jgi:hypothetical protein